ncbi:MAG: ATP-binding protein [Megasphaera massiliensis]|mgnify:CR=1 FL=1|jgi:predicted AAA+ superfamily ATPase|uniref:ATP-binding protein n=1 Tax=Megasphaera massiliensis TaxID=1232428 RepID=UPI002A74F5EA|nr:ATP-binding protein [Megasphaera massiliensis]MDY2964900.1 ATP-binding protein [Megasphaera massiliensis]
MTNRDLYLKKIIKLKDQPLIKVLTGMRRAGKSTLLDLWERKLINDGIAPEHIIHINFEFMLWDDVKDYRALYQLLQEQMAGKEHVYLLLDEIQLVQNWEKAINSIFAEQKADIYVTGSNAKMLSSEIATLLSGRYVLIEVYPLSFREYLDFRPDEKQHIDEAFQQYLQFGGMPVIPGMPQDMNVIQTVLSGIYNTVLMKDIVQRNAVRDPALLEQIVRFLADNIGNPVSTSKISGYLTSQGRKTTPGTVDNYLKMLRDAYIFYRADRYDIKGKLYLKTLEKYYIVDNGLRNALQGFHGGDYGHVLENLVYLELLRRGYEVGVGKLGNLEVDFIASKPTRKVYYQVSASIMDEKTRDRELTPLQQIPDQYEKVVLTMDRTYIKDFNGIRNVNIIDFLLAEEPE